MRLLVWTGILLHVYGLQRHDTKGMAEVVSEQVDLIKGRFAQLEEKDKQQQTGRRRHKTPLVKTDSGENVHEPPPAYSEVIDRGDHEKLPDFADFPPVDPEESSIFSIAPGEAFAPKEIFKFFPSIFEEDSVTEIVTVKEVVRTVKTVEEPSLPPVIATATQEEARTATLVIAPHFALTTVTPEPTMPTKPSGDGWVIYTPGLPVNHEKGAQAAPPQKNPGHLMKSDAMPDAVQLISDLWNDQPVFVTETIIVTSRMLRTPEPIRPTKTLSQTTTARALKKYEKQQQKKAIVYSTFKINPALLKQDTPFTIAPEDVYRGLHASEANALQRSLITSVALLAALIFFL